MSEEKSIKEAVEKAAVDPFAQMVEFYDTFAKSWTTAMSEAVASKSFADSMAQQMESSLGAMTLIRRQMGDLTEQYLQQLNMPTRSELIGLADRLTNLEMAVDDIDAKLDEVLDVLKAKKK